MKKLKNPYQVIPGYYCFGCSSENHHGLQMEFFEDGEYIVCEWEPKHHLQGYFNVLHGGIQTTLMDETANWVVNVKLKTAGVTSKIEVKLMKPVYTDQGKITVRGKLIEMKRIIAIMHCEIMNPDGVIAAKATIHFYTYPEEIAKEKLRYPGHEKYY